MGGLWVDYNLMSNLPGLFVLGEANFSDHGANRLGASALMQGLADGYFIIPTTIAGELANHLNQPVPSTDSPAFVEAENGVREQVNRFLTTNGKRSVDSFHRELGHLVWDYCGMGRTAAGLQTALKDIDALRQEFNSDVRVLGGNESFNQSLEKAGRVADFFELAQLMCQDALHREESCGGHFREEHQTPEGEAQRDDDNFAYVAAWEYKGPGQPGALHKEDLVFENVHLAQRSYK
jgi:succinate dehydrogenase / fumarate reductase flavoprotein subunit